MIDYEIMLEIDALSSAPDDWRRKRHLQKLLQEVHKEYNRTKKLIPVYQAALAQYERTCAMLAESALLFTPCFYVKTETGIHSNWVWKPDGNYSEYEVSK